MCVTQMVRAPKVAKLREVRSLQLTISEAHRLPFKLVPNPYCIISLNQVINLTPIYICFIYIFPSFINHTNVCVIIICNLNIEFFHDKGSGPMRLSHFIHNNPESILNQIINWLLEINSNLELASQL